jgi:protein O-mannosyl-transferase
MGRSRMRGRTEIERTKPPSIGFWAARAVLVVVVWMSFSPILDNGWIDIDDPQNFLQNHAYRGLGWEQVRSAFTTDRLGVYQPVASLLLSVQYTLGGMNPRGYHATSLFLHIFNAMFLHAAVLAILKRCRPRWASPANGLVVWISGLAVALFVAHPLRTEPVAWATSQLYLVCGLFFLSAILAYLRAHPDAETTRVQWLAASYGLSLLAMLSMPGTVVLPLLFILLDYYPIGRAKSGRWLGSTARHMIPEKLPLLLPMCWVMLMAYWAKQTNSTLNLLATDGLWARVAQACHGIWWYLIQSVAPFGVSAYYPRPVGGFNSPWFVGLAALLVAATVAVLVFARRFPWLAAAWMAYLLILGPHLGLIRIGNTIAADRYCYLGLMVWTVVLAAALMTLADWIRSRSHTRLAYAFAAGGLILISGCVVMSRAQSRLWGSSVALWSESVRLYGWSDGPHALLGTALGEAGRFQEAVAELEFALTVRPDSAWTRTNLAAALEGTGDYAGAIVTYARVLASSPGNAVFHMNLGAALAHEKRYEDAIRHYEEGLRIQPNVPELQRLLGTAKLRQGKLGEARAAFEAALRTKPWLVEAHSDLGTILAAQGNRDEAIAHYRAALEEDANHFNSRVNLGIALAQVGEVPEALAQLERVVRDNPNSGEAHHALGAVFAQQGQRERAVAEFATVLQIDPSHAQARYFLGALTGRSVVR